MFLYRKFDILFVQIRYMHYHNHAICWDRQVRAKIVDPDQIPQNTVSDQGLHCWPFIQQFLDTSTGSTRDVRNELLISIWRLQISS